MIVVASSNGQVGIGKAMEVLKAGRAAVEAVEAGIRLVEANPQDHSVGYSGYPNILGQVELDASIMDGRELRSGAVGAIQGFKHPISVARQVMEKLPHVFLVGAGAEHFAAEMGFEREDLLTGEAREVWQKGLQQAGLPAEALTHLVELQDLWHWVELATDPERTRGTVNFIAQDAQGDICGGVSTSGWAWKYPGRLGDSPVIGAGLYVDNRYGAAACTGMGEMAIRASTAHSVVFYMKMGLSLEEAGRRAMMDLNDLGGRYLSRMNFIALDAQGQPAGFSTEPGQSYIYITAEMEEAVKMERSHIAVRRSWG